MKPYDIVADFERIVADYAGATHGVAVDSCTNALLLAFTYERTRPYVAEGKRAGIPRYTYVGVPQAAMNAGWQPVFLDINWKGKYQITGTHIVDSARRFTKDMYEGNTLYCLSFHWSKHLPIGRGGMILTDDENAGEMLRRMRFDGRTAGVHPQDDTFVRGYHCYMLPEEAARGLMLMQSMPSYNEDLPNSDYPDLSKQGVFQ